MRISVYSAVIGGILLLVGCSEEQSGLTQPVAESLRLPADLKIMQGNWESINDASVCGAVVEAYTIRLSYVGQTDGLQHKRNVCIKEINQKSGTLMVYGDKQPWFYQIDRKNEGTGLSLRFFDDKQLQWFSSRMEQRNSPDLVAEL